MSDIASKATELLRLHHTGETLVLPTVWDAWSARAVADAGFPALSIGSHPVADSRGQQDNEGMTLDDALDSVRRIAAAVDIPVTADVESGYDTPAVELVGRVLDAGAVGINVEDTVHSEGRLREVAEHADYIAALRTAADEAGVELVINARTDAFMGAVVEYADPLAEAVTRLRACEEAGARCVYPVRVPDARSLETLLAELHGPVNITAHPVDGAPSGSMDELRAAGVHRVTFGPLLQASLGERLTELVRGWR
ncbi:putative carboxyvinyl-carboxyphosphonate phosphorylmutase [Serinicoccus hydrothermalis]|uniref:Putative carboxyvinyl-carboxyphosphonate phosphorylmutase n=1 Tax=Serinicoccus hydrothermalis TaxID=1758689 RepID=A0A1B1NC41_9MICO|nr:isocitrate lyase/phosphoenolpyruvate mutase family protein [Serinicoccus hydrothermalis]ANS78986.1 putative carboxyvinyl-carboxyphosphonate phosphorylmutase [Serinicoccus hydrothermalis]